MHKRECIVITLRDTTVELTVGVGREAIASLDCIAGSLRRQCRILDSRHCSPLHSNFTWLLGFWCKLIYRSTAAILASLELPKMVQHADSAEEINGAPMQSKL